MQSDLLVVAGEASGDAHAGAVLRALAQARPGLRAFGIGGTHCAAAGLEVLVPAEAMALAGLTEVVGALPRMWRTLRALEAACRTRRPRLALLVDLPDFNLRLARRLKALGIYVLYYVSPQVWAWRQGRVRTIRRVVDEMLVILPFEAGFYRRHGVGVRYVGHPLVEALDAAGGVPTRAAARRALGLAHDRRPYVAVLPGSRKSELRRHLAPMLAGLAELRRTRPDVQALLPVASTLRRDEVAEAVARTGVAVTLLDGHSTQVLAACDVALVCSGTATLQAALVGRPMVVVYRVSRVTYWLLRRMVRVAHVALVNLIAGRALVPELLQDALTPKNVARQLDAMLKDGRRRQAVLRGLSVLRAKLGERRAAAEVAQRALAHLPQP